MSKIPKTDYSDFNASPHVAASMREHEARHYPMGTMSDRLIESLLAWLSIRRLGYMEKLTKAKGIEVIEAQGAISEIDSQYSDLLNMKAIREKEKQDA
jgi:hypothetical protein